MPKEPFDQLVQGSIKCETGKCKVRWQSADYLDLCLWSVDKYTKPNCRQKSCWGQIKDEDGHYDKQRKVQCDPWAKKLWSGSTDKGLSPEVKQKIQRRQQSSSASSLRFLIRTAETWIKFSDLFVALYFMWTTSHSLHEPTTHPLFCTQEDSNNRQKRAKEERE